MPFCEEISVKVINVVCDSEQGRLRAEMADRLVFFKEFFNHEDGNYIKFIKTCFYSQTSFRCGQ